MKKFLDSILKFSEKMSDLTERYLNWVTEFPSIIGIAVLLITVSIPIVICSFSLAEISNIYYKDGCLNSPHPRRYRYPTCEQFIDDEWLKINPFEENRIYQYNEQAPEANK